METVYERAPVSPLGPFHTWLVFTTTQAPNSIAGRSARFAQFERLGVADVIHQAFKMLKIVRFCAIGNDDLIGRDPHLENRVGTFVLEHVTAEYWANPLAIWKD